MVQTCAIVHLYSELHELNLSNQVNLQNLLKTGLNRDKARIFCVLKYEKLQEDNYLLPTTLVLTPPLTSLKYSVKWSM